MTASAPPAVRNFIAIGLLVFAVVAWALTAADPADSQPGLEQRSAECCPCAAEVAYAADLTALRAQDGTSLLDIAIADPDGFARGDYNEFRNVPFRDDRSPATVSAVARAWRCIKQSVP